MVNLKADWQAPEFEPLAATIILYGGVKSS